MSTYIFQPVVFDGVEQPWGALVVVSNKLFTGTAKELVIFSIIIAVLCSIILLVALAFFVQRRVSKPLEGLSGMIERFATLDLRAEQNAHLKPYLERSDEVGIMTRSCGEMAKNLRGIVGQINGSSQSVAAAAQRAVDTMEVSKGLVTETQTSLDETQEKFKKIDEAVAEALEVIARMNTSTEDIVNTSHEVARIVQGLQRLAQENAATSQEGNAAVETQTSSLEGIANASEGLANIATDLQGEVGKFKV